MPQLGILSTVNAAQKSSLPSSIPFSLIYIPSSTTQSVNNFNTVNGVLKIGEGSSLIAGAYNLTPTVTFTANVMVWGAGGGAGLGNNFGGGGGFSTGIITFYAGVSYNVVVGSAGTTASSIGGGGGGSGIEYLANSRTLISAGGGGGGSGTKGGGGGGWGGEAASPSTTNFGRATNAGSPGVIRPTAAPGISGLSLIHI